MPVSGLLLTIDPRRERDIRAALAADSRVEAHELVGTRLVVVLDTPSRAADEAAWAWLAALAGVMWIDLASVSIDPAEADDGSFVRSRRARNSGASI